MFLVLGFYNLTFVVITAVKPPRLNCIGRLALACHRECTLSSRGTKRSRLCHRERSVVLCHRERSVVLCHRERSVAISPVDVHSCPRERNNLVIASAARRSLLSALANPKARLLLRLSCHRERSVAISPFPSVSSTTSLSSRAQRGDLSFQRWPTQKCDCFVPRNDKGEIASYLAMTG